MREAFAALLRPGQLPVAGIDFRVRSALPGNSVAQPQMLKVEKGRNDVAKWTPIRPPIWPPIRPSNCDETDPGLDFGVQGSLPPGAMES